MPSNRLKISLQRCFRTDIFNNLIHKVRLEEFWDILCRQINLNWASSYFIAGYIHWKQSLFNVQRGIERHSRLPGTAQCNNVGAHNKINSSKAHTLQGYPEGDMYYEGVDCRTSMDPSELRLQYRKHNPVRDSRRTFVWSVASV